MEMQRGNLIVRKFLFLRLEAGEEVKGVVPLLHHQIQEAPPVTRQGKSAARSNPVFSCVITCN